MTIEEADVEDAEEILGLQKLAYQSEELSMTTIQSPR
jgi:hypothetical protein